MIDMVLFIAFFNTNAQSFKQRIPIMSRKRMTKIEGNLDRVGRNIEHMEDMYEDVFRKINRLISNETHVNAIISFAKES